MAETIILDPPEVASDRIELDITSDEICPTAEGIDWGNAEIEAYLAEMERGSAPVDYRIPNRTVTIPLIVRATSTYTLDQARVRLQQKVSLIQREGGWLKRVTSGGATVYLDLVNASLKLSGNWLQAHRDIDHEASLTLEAIPEFYEDEIALTNHSETTNPELIFTEAGIRGDTPGRLRLVVTNGSTEDQRGMLLGIRSRNYDSASTAALAYQAEAMTPMDTAATAALTGASGSGNNTLRNASVSGVWWTPILKTDLLSGGILTHTGRYRVWARVYTTAGGSTTMPPKVRLIWGRGDQPQINNAAWQIPGPSSFYLADLGVVDAGDGSGWTGVIQALAGSSTNAAVYIDRVWLLPIDEQYAKLTAPAQRALGLSTFVARDDFDSLTPPTALNGRTALLGGTWDSATFSADSDDFLASDEYGAASVKRASVSDTAGGASTLGGRVALLPGDWGEIELGGEFLTNTWPATMTVSFVCRWESEDRFMGFQAYGTPSGMYLILFITYDGTLTFLAVKFVPAITTTWLPVSVRVLADGTTTAVVSMPTTFDSYGWISVLYSLSGYDSRLASGGLLDSGKAGFWDYNPTATAASRYYTNVYAVSASDSKDAVMFGSQSAELATTGMTREDASGSAYYPIGEQVGSLPRMPVAGLEGRTAELIVKPTRGDLDQLPDTAIDDVSAQAYYRPSWLYVAD